MIFWRYIGCRIEWKGIKMRRILSIVILVVSLFLITIILNVVNWLAGDIEPVEGLDFDALGRGNVHQMVMTGHFWQTYPSVGPFHLLINATAFFFSSILVLSAFYFLALRKKRPLTHVSLACLASGLIPYLTGMFALAVWTDHFTAQNCGPWIAFMLIGMLYCWIASLAFTVLDIFKIDIVKFIPRISLQRPYLSRGSAENL